MTIMPLTLIYIFSGDLGLIVVGGVIPGSNADKCGLFLEGDALESITSAPVGMYIQLSINVYTYEIFILIYVYLLSYDWITFSRGR